MFKNSAFDMGYFDALAKLGYDAKKLMRVNKGGAGLVNPKATSGGTASQVVLPKGSRGRSESSKSDAGF